MKLMQKLVRLIESNQECCDLTTKQMKDIARHAVEMCRVGECDDIEDAIGQQLEDVPGSEDFDISATIDLIKTFI